MSMSPGDYLVGRRGPEAVIPGRVAVWLARRLKLRRLRTEVRGIDPEVDAVLLALAVVAAAWTEEHADRPRRDPDPDPDPDEAASTPGSSFAPTSTPGAESTLTTREAAEELGISPRAVRLALAEGRLWGTKGPAGWTTDRQALVLFEARREQETHRC